MPVADVETARLVNIRTAARTLNVSRMFLYRLRPGTPGLYFIGRMRRFDISEIREWARQRH